MKWYFSRIRQSRYHFHNRTMMCWNDSGCDHSWNRFSNWYLERIPMDLARSYTGKENSVYGNYTIFRRRDLYIFLSTFFLRKEEDKVLKEHRVQHERFSQFHRWDCVLSIKIFPQVNVLQAQSGGDGGEFRKWSRVLVFFFCSGMVENYVSPPLICVDFCLTEKHFSFLFFKKEKNVTAARRFVYLAHLYIQKVAVVVYYTCV